MREYIGRALCAGLGALYMAGAAPMFTFGETGMRLWTWIESVVTPLAQAAGIAPWMVMSALGPLAVGGPLALVWKIAGPGVSRISWFLAGIAAYGGYWWLLLRG
ncbi:MAG: hypothetical protein RLZ98_1805 [Pseudomonadota bacterium]|jgi:hypothetical protein